MPVEMPKGLPFSVDTWTASSKTMKRHHFLTHAHKDHAQGIVPHASYPIYSTSITKTLILQYYPQLDEELFVVITVGESLIVDDPDGDFTVTAFDANHCPGAVMFLFEGNFGNMLHTGDCRLTPECLQSLPEKYVGRKGKQPKCPLNCIFLDCTFGQFHSKMPSRHNAIKQVINCIWKHPDAPTVYLTCGLLGQEEILVEVSQTFGAKIYVDKTKSAECFKSLELTVPEVISEDPSSRFHLFDGFPNLYERAEAKIAEGRANFVHEPLIIRPSTQWYACTEGVSEIEKRRKERFDQAVRDLYGVWHVCYSIHSSKDELEWALQLLKPKWVVSTTPSCRAMELDYVKKCCFKNQRASNDSLWRLLDISAVDADETVESISCSHVVESVSSSCVETQSEPIVISTRHRKRLSLSPPSKRPMVTLFGRARLGLPDSIFHHKERDTVTSSSDCVEQASHETDMPTENEGNMQVKFEELLETTEMMNFEEKDCTSMDMETEEHKFSATSSISSSNRYNENLRRFYRSKNVPIPQPLPSLVKLMDAKNSAKRRM